MAPERLFGSRDAAAAVTDHIAALTGLTTEVMAKLAPAAAAAAARAAMRRQAEQQDALFADILEPWRAVWGALPNP
ncbi:hypothetical protein J8J40_32385, partial [Mycobacterium tuberculosis]|nr:hypothetical protein [Mycobacterium tuberculosis]